MTHLYNKPHFITEICLDLFAAGFEEPTLPLDDLVPVIIGTILVGIFTILVYQWRMRRRLIQVQDQPEEPKAPIQVHLAAMSVNCSDNKFRTMVIDMSDPDGKVLAQLFRGMDLIGYGRDAVYEGVVTLMLNDGRIISCRCFFTNITMTPEESNMARENAEERILARPDIEAAFLEFPVHNNVTHYEGRPVVVLTANRPVTLAFNFEGVPANFHFPIYNGIRIPNLIESRILITTCSSGILRAVNRDDLYEL